MRLRLVATFVLALPFGCQPAGRAVRGLEASPYYPLEVGTTWVYRGPDHERVMRVAKHEDVDGMTCARVQILQDGNLIEEFDICSKSDGIFLVANEGEKLPEPHPILMLPPRPGRTWRINNHKAGTRSQHVYLLGQDDVQVPAGKYHTITRHEEVIEGKARVQSSTFWFARGVGIVKQELKRGGGKRVYELERFERGH